MSFALEGWGPLLVLAGIDAILVGVVSTHFYFKYIRPQSNREDQA